MTLSVMRVLICLAIVLGTLLCGTVTYYTITTDISGTFGVYSLSKACSHQGRGWGEFFPENLLHDMRQLSQASPVAVRCFDLDVVKDAQGVFRVGHPSTAKAVALRGKELPLLSDVLDLLAQLSEEAPTGNWRVTFEPKSMNKSDVELLHTTVDHRGHDALLLRVMEDTAVLGHPQDSASFAALIVRDRDLHSRETTDTWCRMQGPTFARMPMMSPASGRLFDVWMPSWKLWRECAGPQRERAPVLARPHVHVWGVDSLEEECAAVADGDVDMVISNDPLRLIEAQRRGWCVIYSLTGVMT